MWTSRTNGRQYEACLIATSKRAHTRSRWLPGPGSGRPRPRHWYCAWPAGWATAPARVRVAAAAEVTRHSDGVLQTIQEALSQGAITYRDGQVVREPLGSGATVLTFGGAQRQMLPGPVGDLETARLASGAANVVAYIADPAAPPAAVEPAPTPGPRSSPPTGTLP